MNTIHQPDPDIFTPDLESAAEKMVQIKLDYPQYHRAWKSMISTYGVDMVSLDWRGTLGLMRFIEDTAALENNPDAIPGVKLKRFYTAAMFSPDNVYWKISNKDKARMIASTQARAYNPNVVPTPSVLATSVLNISTLKQQYPDQSSMETRMEELFTRSMNHVLSPTEQAEFDILGKLVVGEELTPPQHTPKCEDI